MNKRKLYIWLFGILYGIVAIVSTIHAISFFSLANMILLGIMLAIGFEVGQAAVLFSLLTSPKERNKFVPWLLMGTLTLVQIIGNVYSSYKYLILNSADNLKYFKEPIFIWYDLPDQTCNVILTYIIGGILPLVSLLMTSMVTNYLTDNDKNLDIPIEPEQPIKQIVKNEEVKEIIPIQHHDEVVENKIEAPKEDIKEIIEDKVEAPKEDIKEVIEDKVENKIEENNKVVENVEEEKINKPSTFINI